MLCRRCYLSTATPLLLQASLRSNVPWSGSSGARHLESSLCMHRLLPSGISMASHDIMKGSAFVHKSTHDYKFKVPVKPYFCLD